MAKRAVPYEPSTLTQYSLDDMSNEDKPRVVEQASKRTARARPSSSDADAASNDGAEKARARTKGAGARALQDSSTSAASAASQDEASAGPVRGSRSARRGSRDADRAGSYADSDEDDENLPSSLAPTTRRLLKFLKEAEEELNRGPTEEDIQWENDLMADKSTWGYVRWAGWRSFQGCEWMGEKIANGLGITAPRYQYYIEQAIAQREEERKRREEELSAQESAARTVEAGAVGHSSEYTYEYDSASA